MKGSAEYWFQLLQAAGAVATAVGVAVAAVQLWLQKTQQRTDFEDRLSEQYRSIIAELPLDAVLDQPITGAREGEQLREDAYRIFYRYFDLTNEQIFLRSERRISSDTWKNWEAGIRANMSRTAFSCAWNAIAAAAPDSFKELRRLVPPDRTYGGRLAIAGAVDDGVSTTGAMAMPIARTEVPAEQ